MSSYHDPVLNASCIDHCLLARLRTELVYGSSWTGGGHFACSVCGELIDIVCRQELPDFCKIVDIDLKLLGILSEVQMCVQLVVSGSSPWV